MNGLGLLVFGLLTSCSVFAQTQPTQEELRALYGESTPGEKSVQKGVNRRMEQSEAGGRAMSECELWRRGKGPGVKGDKDCVCPKPLVFSKVIQSRLTYRFCCPEGYIPRAVKGGSLKAASCLPEASDAGVHGVNAGADAGAGAPQAGAVR